MKQWQEASGSMGQGLLGAAVSGFMRSIPLEAPQLKSQVVDLATWDAQRIYDEICQQVLESRVQL